MKQRLAAILAADATGYSRLMSLDERATVAALDASRAVFRSHIELNQGRVIDMAGDSVLAVFETATGAVAAALAVQTELAALVAETPEDQRMRFRIGIHLGDVIEKADGTVYGDGVNIAARLEGLAEPGGITVSESIRVAVKGKVSASFDDLGAQQVKNIADPVLAWRARSGGGPSASPVSSSASASLAIAGLSAATGIDLSAPVPGFGGRPAVAVLPFDNLSGDSEQEYFADGLAEDILTRLAMWRWVPVIARNSSFAFKGRAVDVKEVGRALGARYVLEGSVRKAGNRVRVTGQLIDTVTGHHVWAERYDRLLDDLFALQDELTDGIVGALEAALGRAETERAKLKPPGGLDAWDAYLRGHWHVHKFTREDLEKAIPLLQRSAELDPAFALPLAGIANVRLYQTMLLWAGDPAQALGEAMKFARAAIDADNLMADAYSSMGGVLLRLGKFDDGLAMCERSVSLNPSGSMARLGLGIAHFVRGESEPAMRALETAIRISPNDAYSYMFLSLLGSANYQACHYEKAVEIQRLAAQLGPHYPLVWRGLANALAQIGRLDEARAALARFLAMVPGYTSEKAARASVNFRDEAVFQHYLEGLRKAGWQG